MPAELISSRANARVKQLRGAFAGNHRISDGLVAIEGEHLLEEAVRSGLELQSVFLSGHRALPPCAGRLGPRVEILRLTDDLFASLSSTRAPQGIAALLVPPAPSLQAVLHRTPLLLVAAGVQDPGNLGTLIRSAEAFGASGLLSSPNTVSAWNQKSLRASAGSLFRLPVLSVSPDDLLRLKHSHHLRLFAATVAHSTSEPVFTPHQVDLTQPAALLIGNEGSGLAPEWLALADTLLTIPTSAAVESLNAAIAGSLLLYEAAQQRSSARIPQPPSEPLP